MERYRDIVYNAGFGAGYVKGFIEAYVTQTGGDTQLLEITKEKDNWEEAFPDVWILAVHGFMRERHLTAKEALRRLGFEPEEWPKFLKYLPEE